MANTKEELQRKKRLAYTLYVENGFEQKVIASITGISEKSIGQWKKTDNWEADRIDALMGPEQQRRRVMRQYNELLSQIEARPTPKNVPDSKEADILNKLADSAKKLQTELSFYHKSETGKQFIAYIQQVHGQAKAIEVVDLWHEFLMATS
ncbi:MAG: hypothetical protein KGM16_17795 [Bacteroidota bacterium]|nr:hypothetical protein [Bacteroidota bacterium]